ncbi:MAG TPA: DUF3098 domain-containing protein [Puia sp.]|nr:DUF3098 domain-containing protein [Puia sp.]
MATTKKTPDTPASRTATPAAKSDPSRPKTVIAGSKPKAAAAKSHPYTPLFGKENYRWMLVGIVLVALGLILMAGGKSPDPNVFNKDEVYSVRRITVAPILILAGFVVEIFAIFRKDKPSTNA